MNSRTLRAIEELCCECWCASPWPSRHHLAMEVTGPDWNGVKRTERVDLLQCGACGAIRRADQRAGEQLDLMLTANRKRP